MNAATLGQSLGFGIIIYLAGLLLSLPASLTAGAYLHRAARRRAAPPAVIEIVFALLNPAIYLLVIKPQEDMTNAGAQLVVFASWLSLGVYWAARLVAAPTPLGRKVLRGAAATALAMIAVNAVQDGFAFATGRFASEIPFDWPQTVLIVTALLLYAVPAAIVFRYTVAAVAAKSVGRPVQAFAAIMVTGGFVVALVGLRTPSDENTKAMLRAHHDAIVSAAAAAHIDPATLAATIYCAHRTSGQPLRSWLETVVINAWLADEKSHFLLSRAFDFSIGLAQIKPTTAQTALMIFERSQAINAAPAQRYWPKPYKENRDVPRVDGETWRLDAATTAKISPPAAGTLPKATVVDQLLSEEQNIRYCAFILGLYAAQWEQANPEWSIRQRPAILATLYQRGFERSEPKANPKDSAFGDEVATTQRILKADQMF